MTHSRELTLQVALAALVALLGLGLTGCGDDDAPTAPSAEDQTRLRVVHASPDAPLVDIYVNKGDTPVVTALGYGGASDYLAVAPGTYSVEIRGHGADPTAPAVFTLEGLLLAEGETYTAVVGGLLQSSDPLTRLRVLALEEDFVDPGAGNAAARIVHASPDAPAVALDVANDGTPEVTDLARFADTGPAGVALPAGEPVRIGVWAGQPPARAAVFTMPALPEGDDLFVIATGLVGGDPQGDGFGLLAVGPEGAIGLVRQDAKAVVHALHGSPDAPPVDIDADGVEVVTGLAFGGLGGRLEVWPGAYVLDFRVAGATDVAASGSTPYLEPGVEYLAVATGYLGGDTPGFQILPAAAGFDGPAGDALVRVVHASPDAPPVDVGTVSGGTLTAVADFTGLAFAETSPAAGTGLPIGPLAVGVATTGSTEPVAVFDLETAAGLRAFAVACGSLGDTGESFRLVMVFTGQDGWSAAEVLPRGP